MSVFEAGCWTRWASNASIRVSATGYNGSPMSEEITFCQRCGHRLAQKQVEGKTRPYCPACGFVVYVDPKVAALVLVSTDGKLVLVKRGVQPALGRWSFPSGYVDRGEAVEDAAVREVKEETGLDVRLMELVGLYSQTDSPVVLAVFSAEVTGGELCAGSDIREVRLFSPDRLPSLPFPHDEQIVSDWRALRQNHDCP